MALVLVIEDDDDLRAGLATGLSRAGFEIAEAADGEAAFVAISELRPDLILCDICLPRMSGHTLLRRVRAEFPDLGRMPFLFLTALGDRQDVLTGHELGADEYLTKPIDLELLIAIVNKRLAQSSRWAAHYASDLERERASFLITLSEQTQLSFLSAAEVLHHLAEGILLLNQSGKAIFINRYARRILAEEDGVALSSGMLVGGKYDDTQQIRQRLAIALATPGARDLAPLMLPRPSGRSPYAMRVSRLEAGLSLEADSGPVVAVFVSDPEPRTRPQETALISLYQFTPTEARIAADMTVGLSVNEIAQSQGISRNTVHHHLKSIFRKTGAARQSELVSVILSGTAVQPSIRISPH